VIYDENYEVLAKLSEPIGVADSALAEWRALVEVLKLARSLGATDVELNLDELGIVDALCDAATIRAPHLVPYYEEARELMAQFATCDVLHVLRTGNTVADDLAGGAAGANPNYRRLKRNSRSQQRRKGRH
jgi:ribonuclease HI